MFDAEGNVQDVTLAKDEYPRADTTLEKLATLNPAFDPTGSVTAGNSSPLTDDVEDPVGAPPARKATGALGRFWDTFIAPHQIRFEIRRDHVIGRDVFRDAVIHTRIGPHVAIEVPAYLLCQLDDGAHAAKEAVGVDEPARLIGVTVASPLAGMVATPGAKRR